MSHHGRTGSSRSPRTTLALTTLGQVSLAPSGWRRGPAAFGPGKPVALITYLACASGRAAERDRLVDLLWSDRAADAGRHDLRQTLWHLRQRLGSGVVTARHGQVALVAEVTCDRDAFIAAVDGGDLERGVALYGGEFLPGVVGSGARGFDEWAELERYRLRRMFCRAGEALVRQSLAAGRFDGALELAKRVRDAHPDDEACCRLHLEALLAAGERGRAASEADVLEWHLAVGGREPEPATRQVLRRARRRVEGDVAPDTRLATARLVGREQQLARMLQAWEAVRRGVGTHLDVASAAGFGKTRFLKETGARLTSLGARAVYLAASPTARDVSHVFASDIASALAVLPGAAGISHAAGAALVALSPSLSSRFAAGADSAAGDEAIRRRMLALLELLQALSDEQPLVLLLDDLHWADAGSRQVIHGVLERVGSVRGLIITAARPIAPAHPLTPTSMVLHLPPLELDHVGTLLTDLGALPVAPWADNLPAGLRSVAAGSPLVLLDVLQGALDNGVLTLSATGWSCHNPEMLATELEGFRARRIQPIDSHPRSLLVVPFAPAPPGEVGPLSDGFTERLIAALSRIGALRVISWPSARKLRGVGRAAATLAGELNARYVLQGSLRAGDGDMHITAQLTDAVSGAALWGESCRGTLRDLSDIEQRFARSIAEALLVALSPVEDDRIRRLAIPNARAYECYVRAREAIWHGHTPDRLRRAASLLRTGLRQGGDNALLYSALGTVYATSGLMMVEGKWSLRRSEICTRKALALDPESAETHYLRGLVRCRRGDLKEGVRDLLKTLSIDPHHTDALFWCAGWLGSLGKLELARPLAQRFLEIDPLTPARFSSLGWLEWVGGRFEPALKWFRLWFQLEPQNPAAMHATASLLIWNQRFEESAALFDELSTVAPGSPWSWYKGFVVPAVRGDRTGALAGVTPGLTAAAESFEGHCLCMAACYAMIDVRDQAVEWLERAVRRGFINYPMLAEHDPFLKRLRGFPPYDGLMERVKREWESLEL